VKVPTGDGIIMIKLSEEYISYSPEPRMKACILIINFRSSTSKVSEY